ncbi:unnamed protein product [Vitrella brassicaformis CCMP3155]|uniref:SKP1 component POZ domain-containing protein n=1 Tax=Vitrella brassicaformis (strain CCMP3155) TaxID=1169540 RepID=A0A0G4FIC7_VITBC|nr:unnamed protein product [Vitrella brassicaformis CCMP3155]|eukprot:CEM13190.1 unnamed protein product [Vitrella brassicaformis CCMP3155]
MTKRRLVLVARTGLMHLDATTIDAAVQKSDVIADMSEGDADEPLPVRQFSRLTLMAVLEYCERHVADEDPWLPCKRVESHHIGEVVSDGWDAFYLRQNEYQVLRIMKAADFFNIPSLLQLTQLSVACYLNRFQPHQVGSAAIEAERRRLTCRVKTSQPPRPTTNPHDSLLDLPAPSSMIRKTKAESCVSAGGDVAVSETLIAGGKSLIPIDESEGGGVVRGACLPGLHAMPLIRRCFGWSPCGRARTAATGRSDARHRRPMDSPNTIKVQSGVCGVESNADDTEALIDTLTYLVENVNLLAGVFLHLPFRCLEALPISLLIEVVPHFKWHLRLPSRGACYGLPRILPETEWCGWDIARLSVKIEKELSDVQGVEAAIDKYVKLTNPSPKPDTATQEDTIIEGDEEVSKITGHTQDKPNPQLRELRKGIRSEVREELDALKKSIEKSEEASRELDQRLAAAKAKLEPRRGRRTSRGGCRRSERPGRGRRRWRQQWRPSSTLYPTKAVATTITIEGEEAAIGGTGCCGGSWGCWGLIREVEGGCVVM